MPTNNPPLEISCHAVRDALSNPEQDFVLIDCRETEEHTLVAIKDAVLLPMSEIPDRVSEIGPHRDAPIVVYCHHGMRSAQVASWLRSQGFAQAQSMAGGIDQWALEIEPNLPRY